MTVVGDHLDAARRSLRAATSGIDVWQDARAMIAGMLERGVRHQHRQLIARAVTAWPA